MVAAHREMPTRAYCERRLRRAANVDRGAGSTHGISDGRFQTCARLLGKSPFPVGCRRCLGSRAHSVEFLVLLKKASECGMRGVRFRLILLHNVRINKKPLVAVLCNQGFLAFYRDAMPYSRCVLHISRHLFISKLLRMSRRASLVTRRSPHAAWPARSRACP